MNKGPFTRFHQIPGEILARGVKNKSLEVAGNDSFEISLYRVGYLLRSYEGLLHGESPLSSQWEVDGIDPIYSLPSNALDSLTTIARACLTLVKVSSETDAKPILQKAFQYKVDNKGNACFGVRDVIPPVQGALEDAYDPDLELREHMVENELRILTGDVDPAVTKVLRLSGPSIITRDAARNLALTIGEEFGSIFGGLELLIPDSNERMRDTIAHDIGTIVGSQWQHPEWKQPDPYRV